MAYLDSPRDVQYFGDEEFWVNLLLISHDFFLINTQPICWFIYFNWI